VILILIVNQNSKDRGKMLQRQNAKLDGHVPRQQRYLSWGAKVDKNIEPVALNARLPVRGLRGQVRVHDEAVGLRETQYRSPNEYLEKSGPTLEGWEERKGKKRETAR
jgi:hypothetical protein